MTGVLTLFLLLTLAWLSVVKRADVSRLLALSVAAYILLWALVPLGYVALRPGHTLYPLLDERYVRIVDLHLLSLSSALAIFAALPVRRSKRLGFWGSRDMSPRTTYWSFVGAVMVLAICEAWSLSMTGWGFLANVQFAVKATADESGRKALLDAVLIIVVGFAVAGAVRDWTDRKYGSRVLILAWTMLLVHAAIAITQGARAAVLLPLFVFLARSWTLGRARGLARQWRAIVILGTAGVVLGPLLIIIGLTRDLGDTKMTTSLMSQAFTRTFEGRSLRDQLLLVTDGIYVKFEHFQTGVTLLSQEGEGRAGWHPIVSALYSPIPRIVLPEKPVPLSRNGEVTGMPWRIAASATGDVMKGAVVPVAPAAVALWEFGWLGIALLILANVFHLVFVNSLLSCRSLLHQALGISLLSLPTTEFLFTGPAYLLRDDLRLLLYIVALLGLSTVLKHGRRYLQVTPDTPATA